MEFTYENLEQSLEKGDFSQLKNKFENELLDVKEFPYNLPGENEELCKDVSAMLNNQGGFIVFGVQGEKEGEHVFERIKKVVGMKDKIINEQQYIQCLENYMYPLEPSISIKEATLEGEDVFYIKIPKSNNKPFFRKRGSDFQYWIRNGSHSTQEKMDRLHEIARNGLYYEDHLIHIEKNVEQLVQNSIADAKGSVKSDAINSLKKQL